MQHWDSICNAMQGDYERLQDSRLVFDAVFAQKTTKISPAASQAAVDFALDLCQFLSKYEQRGVFDALLDNSDAQNEARERLLNQLQECLRVEAILLERAGLKPDKVKPLMEDMRSIARPPYPLLAPDVWEKHVHEAIGVACNFPRSSVVLLASNGWEYVQELRKKYQWVTGAVVGVANIVTAVQDPTLIGAAKVSKYLGVLLALGHQGGEAFPGTPT